MTRVSARYRKALTNKQFRPPRSRINSSLISQRLRRGRRRYPIPLPTHTRPPRLASWSAGSAPGGRRRTFVGHLTSRAAASDAVGIFSLLLDLSHLSFFVSSLSSRLPNLSFLSPSPFVSPPSVHFFFLLFPPSFSFLSLFPFCFSFPFSRSSFYLFPPSLPHVSSSISHPNYH